MKTTEGSQTNNQELVSALLSFLTDEQVSINETILNLHSKDESYHKGSHPDIPNADYSFRGWVEFRGTCHSLQKGNNDEFY